MHENAFMEMVHAICGKDGRYAPEAYVFVRQGLDLTVKMLDKPRTGPKRHVSGRELLDGLRRYALQEFGPLSQTVLATWGVKDTTDFGEIVFNLVESGVLGKTDNDTRADFADAYDFDEAFAAPFRPRRGTADQPAVAAAGRGRGTKQPAPPASGGDRNQAASEQEEK
jgi:uncharacterized repeat protein (TIGR04138 family)